MPDQTGLSGVFVLNFTGQLTLTHQEFLLPLSAAFPSRLAPRKPIMPRKIQSPYSSIFGRRHMSKEVTRRKFLKQSGGSFVALTAPSQFSALSVSQIWEEVERASSAVQPSSALSDAHRKLLRAAADEIIPAADGPLAATQAGA